MKRASRKHGALLVGIGVALLLSTGIQFATRARSDGHESERRGLSAMGGRSPKSEEAGPAKKERDDEWVASRVNSLLAVKPGEIGIVRLPAGGLEQHFELIEPLTDWERDRAGLAMGVVTRDQGRASLEAILMNGGKLGGKIGRVEDGLGLSNERMSITIAHAGGDELVSDLKVEFTDAEGQLTVRTGITVFKGSPTIFRSAYPNPEGFLILVGEEEKAAAK